MVLFFLSSMAIFWVRYSRSTFERKNIEIATAKMIILPQKRNFAEENV